MSTDNLSKLVSYRGLFPEVADDVFIADGARLIGDVTVGAGSSVWYNTVLRGDVHPIRIGEGTNLQDLVLGHTSNGRTPLVIGSDCTIGHGAIVHGCTIEDGALVGMGSIALDESVISEGAILAAGAVLTERTVVPAGTLWAGVPARYVRELDPAEITSGKDGADGYRHHAALYRAEG